MQNRHDFSFSEIEKIYNQGLLELISSASAIHKTIHSFKSIHLNTLISYKTGGCGEDCAYCAQSSRYSTHISAKTSYLNSDQVIEEAAKAKSQGAERVCISASWRTIPSLDKLNEITELGKSIRKMGLNVCCTLGMVNEEQIIKLKDAGFTAFNHNLDTSERYYPEIVTTRKYGDRLKTLQLLQENDMPYCSGGIIGMGENVNDRLEMLLTLANQPKHPYSLPLNMLVPVQGTPLEHLPAVAHWDMVKLIATARIIMPQTIICLAAGRQFLNDESQALCFLAGANSIFTGEKLLTTENINPEKDKNLLQTLGLTIKKSDE